MLQAILQRAVAALQKVKNFYTVVEVNSMAEFLKFVRNEKSPKVYIFLSWADYNKHSNEPRSCFIRFMSFLEDGRAVDLKIQEEVRFFGPRAKDRKTAKLYINCRLLNDSVKPQVQIMVALMPNAEIEVKDLYGRLVNLDEFKPELF